METKGKSQKKTGKKITADPAEAKVTKVAAASVVKAAPAKRAAKAAAKSVKKAEVVDVSKSELSPKTAKKPAAKKTSKKVVIATGESKVPSSPVARVEKAVNKPIPGAETIDLSTQSPAAKLLAEPALPELGRENRARLQMQTPARLYFYWSVRENPWALLRKAFGDDTGSYTLVLKLVELRSENEQIHNADAEGNWWFDVQPGGQYRAEIGFYAPNRPYFRVVYSNVIETPRQKPSPRRAAEPEWTVSADKFAQVLDVAGFSKDAVDVAIAGDDISVSAVATRSAFAQFTGSGSLPEGVADEDIRYAMLEMAAGQKLDDLRWRISARLFEYLQANERKLDTELAKAALKEHFEIDEVAFESEEIGPAVYGASLVNFPRTLRSRRTSGPGYSPASSHSNQGLFGRN